VKAQRAVIAHRSPLAFEEMAATLAASANVKCRV